MIDRPADPLQGMTPDQRSSAARGAEALGRLLRGLLGAASDPAERLRMARHLAGTTPAIGLRPEAIAPHDVTDEGLAGHIAAVSALRRRLADAAPPRHLGALRQTPSANQGGARHLGPVR